MTRFGKFALTSAIGSCAAASVAFATPVSITSSSFTYTQNFDSLSAGNSSTAASNAPTSAWTNSSTINGWVAFRSLPGGSASTGFRDNPGTAGYNPETSYISNRGNTNTGAIYAYGSISDPDRALGSIGSGTPGDFFYGVEFTNDSGGTINDITISYRGEQWRNGGNGTSAGLVQSLRFDYSRTAASYSDNANFTAAPALDFTSPNTATQSASFIDGNAVGNNTNVASVLTGVGLLPGETLRLRWWDDNDAGNDHGLSIDDFSFSVGVPEPTSLGLIGLVGAGLTRRRRR